jgi:hypothetical protein
MMFCNTRNQYQDSTRTGNAPLHSTQRSARSADAATSFLTQKIKGTASVQYDTRIIPEERQRKNKQETKRENR